MGNPISYVRFHYTTGGLQEGTPDINGKSLSSVNIAEQSDLYIFGIYIETSISFSKQLFSEYLEGGSFSINPAGESDIDVCILDGYYNVCPTLIKKITNKSTGEEIPLTRIYMERPITSCNTYSRRIGSVVANPVNFNGSTKTYETGKLCRLSIGDYKQTIEKHQRCCLMNNINYSRDVLTKNTLPEQYLKFTNLSIESAFNNTCPAVFSNGFATTHCDVILEPYCASNPNSDVCKMFMMSKFSSGKATLSTFVNHCSSNLHDPVCVHLSLAAKDNGNSGIVDQIISNYCDKNLGDKSCACYLTSKSLPSNFKDNYYLGPIACWYKPCAELSEPQFLPYEYYLQRNKCTLTNCIIDIGKISEQPNMIDLINYCRSKKRDTVVKSNLKTYFDDEIWSPGNLGILTVSLITLAILLPTCMIPFRKIRNKWVQV